MSTKPKAMGEITTGTTKPRDMGNVAANVRDDGSILLKKVIKDLEKITKNQVNSEEEMETVAAGAISDLNILLQALMEVGAKVTPHYELQYLVEQSGMRLPVMA